MEDEKKKKKNKKKKNKQNKTNEDVAAGVGETAFLDQNHIVGQNHHNQVSETAGVQNAEVGKPNVDLDRHRTNGTEGSVLAEADKQYWMQREASLEEMIRELKNEKDSYIQKQAVLEMRIVQLQNEIDSWLQKEAGLEEKVSQLLDEKGTLSLKGANLEQKIVHLEREKDSRALKEANLEEKIVHLEREKDSWVLKEANLEEKIVHLEREKDFWVLKENSTDEIIARLNDDNTRLRIQMMELEESRNKIIQENQLLKENISGLQSQIQNLESTSSARSSTETTKHASENEDFNSQMEAALSLVEKLITENTGLVEKVNELNIELDRRTATTGPASAIGTDSMDETVGTASVADPMLEYSQISVSDENTESLEAVPIKDDNTGFDNLDIENTAVIANYSEPSESGEIVQIPLDENEVQDVELPAAESDEMAAVPLTDAPLIGAPFRLISFFAKYVSGADLVNQSSS